MSMDNSLDKLQLYTMILDTDKGVFKVCSKDEKCIAKSNSSSKFKDKTVRASILIYHSNDEITLIFDNH